MPYSIGEMASLLSLTPSTQRYYEKEGLLPFVERSKNGRRLFEKKDLEWLNLIECLKKTGMPIKDIRAFLEMTMEGDATISPRLELFRKQRAVVEQKIKELQETLEVLAFKEWYYQTAESAGSTAVPRNMSDEELPERFRTVRRRLKGR